MQRRNRNILVVLIGVIIAVAILSSFGLGLFAPDTAKIVLPDPAASPIPSGGGESAPVRVEVTPETVQRVVATLARPESYSRALSLEDFWGEGESGVTQVQVWVEDGWTRTRAELPGGLVRHTIVGAEQFWLWYEGESGVLTGPADDSSADLEGQRIPGYEDLLELDRSAILSAGYAELDGLGCVYAETESGQAGYTTRWWVDDDSGLLVRSESWRGEELVCRMTAGAVERPAADPSFVLPDGTVLYQRAG